jgi:hypothetical protein
MGSDYIDDPNKCTNIPGIILGGGKQLCDDIWNAV